jgi:SAM-dependent methyltransferase
MPQTAGHKWFAAFWDWQTRHEPAKIRAWRDEIAGGARGRVLEIGCGGGANFPHYSNLATEIVATDPDPFMLERARRRASELQRVIELQEAAAERLPVDDASFDTVVSTVNMCSVSDPARALAEVKRVLRPGGEYRFFDHVRYKSAIGGFIQDIVTPLWKWGGAGCHPNRDVERFIRTAGLDIVEIQHVKPVPPVPPMIIVRPCIKGIAIRR